MSCGVLGGSISGYAVIAAGSLRGALPVRHQQPRRPVESIERVIRVLMVSWAEPIPDRRIQITTVNGGPGLVASSGDTPVAALILGIADGRVQTVYLVANPDKLAGVRAEAAP